MRDSDRTHRIRGRYTEEVVVGTYTRARAIKAFCTECMGYSQNPMGPVRPESAEKWQEKATEEGIPIPTGTRKDGSPLKDEGCVSFLCPLFPYRGWSKVANDHH